MCDTFLGLVNRPLTGLYLCPAVCGEGTPLLFSYKNLWEKRSLSQLISGDALIRPLGLFEKSPKNLPYKWTGVRDLPTPVIISLL